MFARLDPAAFQTCFRDWVHALGQHLPDDVVAIDGKTLRRTHDAAIAQSPLHLVSAWSTAQGLVLGQLATDAKTNEITVIPQLLDLLDLHGQTVTIDAMGCQTAIAEAIVTRNSHYVLACKKNQPTLFADILSTLTPITQAPAPTDATYHCTTEHGHGRTERRELWCTDQRAPIRTRDHWAGMRSIALARSTVVRDGTETTQTRLFLSSLPADACQLAHAIRGHWGIENQLHWVLDTAFHEDDSRSRIDHSAANLAVMRHMVLNLFQGDTSRKGSKRNKRLRASWNDDYILTIIRVARSDAFQS